MHIFAGRSIGHKPLHFWHHFLQKHFTHLVLLFLPRSFFLKLKLFSLRHNSQDSKFDTFLSSWFGIGSPTVGVSKKPVHVKYFSTSCLTSDHKCLSNELTNSKRGEEKRRIPKYNEHVTRKGKSFVRLSSVYQNKSSVGLWPRSFLFVAAALHCWPPTTDQLQTKTFSAQKEKQGQLFVRDLVLISFHSGPKRNLNRRLISFS